MPWSNQSGGGPWGPKGPSNPWGGGQPGGKTPPDLEEWVRRGQERLKTLVPGGPSSGRSILLIVLAAIALWLATGFYTVRPNEVGLNLLFGKFIGKSAEGLRYNFPYPIGAVIKPRVTDINRTEIGYRSGGAQGRVRDVIEESLMLTGDENIIDIDFDVQWQINAARAEDYVFNLQNPEGTIKAVAESAMREVIGRRNIQSVLTTDQANVSNEVRQLMQQHLDSYNAGIIINVVQLQAANPPAQVRESFYDVNAAQQDQVRMQNEAETYASRVVPEARGEASRIVQQADGYRERAISEAAGQASRFTQVLEQYRKAPAIIRERIFIETMERILSGTDKIIIDQKGQGVMPYLPLTELQRRAPAPVPSQGNVR